MGSTGFGADKAEETTQKKDNRLRLSRRGLDTQGDCIQRD